MQHYITGSTNCEHNYRVNLDKFTDYALHILVSGIFLMLQTRRCNSISVYIKG